MTESQKRLRELRDRKSKDRQAMAEFAALDKPTPDQVTAFDALETAIPETERQLRAATLAAEAEDQDATVNTDPPADAETRERLELRSRCTVKNILRAALAGRAPVGAEAELQQSLNLDANHIPLELWEKPPEQRAITAAPTTGTGVNLAPLQPEIFAPGVAARLGIEMPAVVSGAYSTATVTKGADAADAVAKGADVPEVASTWTVGTTTPKRVGTSLNLAAEDIAAVGQSGFEAFLKSRISMVLLEEIDSQMLNGAGANDDLTGIFERLTNPSAPAANVETWTRFLAIQSGLIDGKWAMELEHIQLLVGVETFQLAAATFQGTDAEMSAASYLKKMGAGFSTNSRMPLKAAHIQQGIACRKGRPGNRLAVCPHWGYLSIDDIFSGARRGERRFVTSVLLGDVLIVQPDAYAQVAFRVSV